MARSYCLWYWKRNMKLATRIGVMCFVPLLLVSLRYDVLEYDLLAAFAVFPLIWAVASVCSLSILRFTKMIRCQEKLYGVSFGGDGVKTLDESCLLGRDWLILPGRYAFYRKHICKMQNRISAPKSPAAENVTIFFTQDGKKYRVRGIGSRQLAKIREWVREVQ